MLAPLLLQLAQVSFPIVPAPVHLVPGVGSFAVSRQTVVAVSDPASAELRGLRDLLATILTKAFGVEVRVVDTAVRTAQPGTILLVLDAAAATGAEGYRLEVTSDGVTLRASKPAGLFYGIQTLAQIPPAGASAPGIPAVRIEDAPRFPYRGMHLDVGRHLFPVEFIKRYIDLMALYKMNTFHWHLTDDQGWRIAIAKYPRLTTVGAWRKETILQKNFDPYVGDGIPYGGFYTQDEVRDIVAYARQRYVTVIPEIEMPGHSKAALAAYPDLACTPGPFEVSTVWGVDPDIYCPSERTFQFLEDVLTEVMALFPGQYIHIGGDEAPKDRWRASPVAQQVIKREHLKDESELQSWFIRRIEQFLIDHGRRLIGWDEILEGGLAPEAIVMSWRGMDGGIAAARQGHDVIMTPGSHVYFDHYQGDPAYEPLAIGGYTPLDKVYGFEPVPDSLTPAEATHVLGAQGNVWTEYIATPEYVEYMAVPRMLALAEVVWSPRDRRDWNDFVTRLPAQLHRLDALAVRYRVPGVTGLETDQLRLQDTTTVTLGSLLPDATIVYRVDADATEGAVHTYDGPFRLPVTRDGVTVVARVVLPGGRASPLEAARFTRTTLLAAANLRDNDVAPGLRYDYYEGRVSRTAALGGLRSRRHGTAMGVALQGFERPEEFGLRFQGYVHVPADGVYQFMLTSDDGSVLRIGKDVVVDHDGPHTPTDRTGMIALAAGYHPIEVLFFQAGGGRELRLQMGRAGEPLEPVPTAWLFHRR
jgi:hexosaminidase